MYAYIYRLRNVYRCKVNLCSKFKRDHLIQDQETRNSNLFIDKIMLFSYVINFCTNSGLNLNRLIKDLIKISRLEYTTCVCIFV